MMILLNIRVIILGGVAFGFEAVDVELLELCHVAQSFRYTMYVPSHAEDLAFVFQTFLWTHCPVREVKVDGVSLERQQRKIYQISIFSLRLKLPKIDKNRNRYFGHRGRGFGVDLSVRTKYCPVEQSVKIACNCKFMVREDWGDHEAIDVIAKLWRKPHQWECRSIMSLLSLHVSES